MRFTNLSLLDTVAPRRVNWRQHAAVGLALLTLAEWRSLFFAKPSKDWPGPGSVETSSPSSSPWTSRCPWRADRRRAEPNREPPRLTAKQFLAPLPAGLQGGLVSFARHARSSSPPTTDHPAWPRAQPLKLAEHTATGEGIFTALDVMKQALGGTPRTPSGQEAGADRDDQRRLPDRRTLPGGRRERRQGPGVGSTRSRSARRTAPSSRRVDIRGPGRVGELRRSSRSPAASPTWRPPRTACSTPTRPSTADRLQTVRRDVDLVLLRLLVSCACCRPARVSSSPPLAVAAVVRPSDREKWGSLWCA